MNWMHAVIRYDHFENKMHKKHERTTRKKKKQTKIPTETNQQQFSKRMR